MPKAALHNRNRHRYHMSRRGAHAGIIFNFDPFRQVRRCGELAAWSTKNQNSTGRKYSRDKRVCSIDMDAMNRILLDPQYHDILAILKGFRNGIDLCCPIEANVKGLVYGAKIRAPHAAVMVFLFRTGTSVTSPIEYLLMDQVATEAFCNL